ncbi:MAG: hypothetical protein ACREEM_09900 [Blastocatellia bacterium]
MAIDRRFARFIRCERSDDQQQSRFERSPGFPGRRSPTRCVFCPATDLPPTQPAVTHAHDFAHALRLRAKGWMAQKAANVPGCLIGQDIEINQTITGMPQPGFVKILIASKEGRTSQPVQKRNDLFPVVQTLTANLVGNLAKVNSPFRQRAALSERDVFVEDIHAARRRLSSR